MYNWKRMQAFLSRILLSSVILESCGFVGDPSTRLANYNTDMVLGYYISRDSTEEISFVRLGVKQKTQVFKHCRAAVNSPCMQKSSK
jgi:hypothetical protein